MFSIISLISVKLHTECLHAIQLLYLDYSLMLA